MADVYNRVFLHLIWATYDRLPKLTPEVGALACRKIIAEAEELRCPVQAIGGIEDHLQEFPTLGFKWQGTYGVVPVSTNSLPRVLAYVAHQEEHHREKSLSMADFSSPAANSFDGETNAI